jgi:two-component system cell cycle response regulator
MTQTILVVDDDPGMLEYLAERLAPEGFTVFTAATGQDGIAQAIGRQPDLILLDLRLPVTDGVAVCHALRAETKTAHTPILVVTGVHAPAQLEESMTSGADDFVSKPIDIPDMLVRIHALLACRTITDPIERLSRYVEMVRQTSAKSARPVPPAHNE